VNAANNASNPNWSDSSSGNVYQMQRYFLHTDVHLGERFRFFGELATSLLDGRNGGPRPSLDEEKMYVHQVSSISGCGSRPRQPHVASWATGDCVWITEFVSTRDGRNIRRSVDGPGLLG